MNDTKIIIAKIISAERTLKNNFHFLKYQNTIGTLIFAFSFFTAVAIGILFLDGAIPWYLAAPAIAISLSFIREIEHDLAHNLYFKNHRLLQNFMMLATWPLLGNVPNPWFRRRMHLLHHKTSGGHEDFEERLIGNGLAIGPLRIASMIAPEIAFLFRQEEMKKIKFHRPAMFVLSIIPFGLIYYLAGYGFLIKELFLGMQRLIPATPTPFPDDIMYFLNNAFIVYVLPNFIRQVSVQVLSSILHYHGDVESRNQEIQILTSVWTWPFQVFSCFFGATHAIHHFVVAQPFYIRTILGRQCNEILIKHGIRKNDVDSLFRMNRFLFQPHKS